MRVLLVDDDPELLEQLAALVTDAGYRCERAPDADTAHQLIEAFEFSAVVLDLGLPDGDGLALLQRWRRSGRDIPVLVLSARGTPEQRADGLEAGANDYLAKPYHPRELIARLRRLLLGAHPVEHTVALGPEAAVEYWPGTGEVARDGEAVALSGTLRQTLDVLVAAKGRPVSKSHLLDQVADLTEGATENAAEQWIRRLRQKLGAAVIDTEPGLGYRIVFAPPSDG